MKQIFTRELQRSWPLNRLSYLRRGFDLDLSCKLWLPFYKYGSEQSKIWDQSGNNNHGIITGAVLYPGNPQMTSIGSTYSRGDFTNDNAFFWSSIDMSAYAGTDVGSTPYWIRVVDSAGKIATGYLAGIGSGETLGGELIVNGSFTDWTGGIPNGWTRNIGIPDANNYIEEVPADQLHMVTNTSYNKNIYQAPLTIGWLLTVSFDINDVTVAGDGVNFSCGKDVYYFTIGSKQHYNGATSIYSSLYVNSGDYTIDNCSAKRIIEPPSTAVHIVSSLNGTTRAWENVGSGFDPNNIVSWRIDKIVPDAAIGWSTDGVDDKFTITETNYGKVHTILFWLQHYNIKQTILGGADTYRVSKDEANIYYNAGATEVLVSHGVTTGWHCYAITRNGTGVNFYVDGLQVGTEQTLDANNDLTVSMIGYGTGGVYAIARWGELPIFNRVLSAQEIRNYFEMTRHIFGV